MRRRSCSFESVEFGFEERKIGEVRRSVGIDEENSMTRSV
jgi:hypothetical protein